MTKLIENIKILEKKRDIHIPLGIVVSFDVETTESHFDESLIIELSTTFKQQIKVPRDFLDQAVEDFKQKLILSMYADLYDLLYKLRDAVYEGNEDKVYNLLNQIFKETRLR